MYIPSYKHNTPIRPYAHNIPDNTFFHFPVSSICFSNLIVVGREYSGTSVTCLGHEICIYICLYILAHLHGAQTSKCPYTQHIIISGRSELHAQCHNGFTASYPVQLFLDRIVLAQNNVPFRTFYRYVFHSPSSVRFAISRVSASHLLKLFKYLLFVGLQPINIHVCLNACLLYSILLYPFYYGLNSCLWVCMLQQFYYFARLAMFIFNCGQLQADGRPTSWQ